MPHIYSTAKEIQKSNSQACVNPVRYNTKDKMSDVYSTAKELDIQCWSAIYEVLPQYIVLKQVENKHIYVYLCKYVAQCLIFLAIIPDPCVPVLVVRRLNMETCTRWQGGFHTHPAHLHPASIKFGLCS